MLVGPPNLFTLAKPKLNKHKGFATLTADIPGPGELVLKGKRIKKQAKTAADAGKDQLNVRAAGKSAKKLKKLGKVKVTAEVTYTPSGGEPNTESTKLKLWLRR